MRKLFLSILLVFLVAEICFGQQVKPSYRQGVAHNEGESAHPSYWRGLIGAWVPSLGVTGITTLHDVSGNGNHGTLNSSMTAADWVIGEKGYALDFDGSDDVVDLGTPILSTTDASQPYTFVSRVKTTDTDGGIIGQYASGDPGRFAMRIAAVTGGIEFWKAGILFRSTEPINDGIWHHLVLTKTTKGFVVLGYIDGVLADKDSGTGTDGTAFADANTVIGDFSVTVVVPFDGEIEMVLIYDKALTANEIKFLYANPMAPFQLKSQVFIVPAVAGTATRKQIIVSQLIDEIYFSYLLN